MTHVLVVDDDSFFQDLVKSTLSEHQLTAALSGQEALSVIAQQTWDLIILDVDLGDLDGYQVCEQLREQGIEAPILFLSSLKTVENRLKAYGCGANDYLAKPYEHAELRHKAHTLIEESRRRTDFARQISEHNQLITNSQAESYHLQAVNEFVQLSTQSKNETNLTRLFFMTLKKLSCSGLLVLNHAKSEILSVDGHITHLESEILGVADKLPRIHSFGNDRGLFNWQSATLLVRNMGPLIDILAILMDALEQALQDIQLQDQLLQEIAEIECDSGKYQARMQQLMNDMSMALQDGLLTLGLTASLSEEEEAYISEIVEYYSNLMQEPLKEQQQHNLTLRKLIDQMKTPSAKIVEQLNETDSSEDSIELF